MFKKPSQVTVVALLLLFSIVNTNVQQVESQAFNFEISKRTESTIKQFMSVPHIPNQITKHNMQVDLLDVSGTENMRKNFFAQLISFPSIYMIYAGFENGFFSGYFRKTADPITYQYTDRKAGDNDTRLYWWADNTNGDVLYNQGIQRSRQYDPRVRGWYKQTKEAMTSVWSSIYIFASSNQLGLTACEPVTDSNGDLVGVLAVDYTLGDIDKFLTDEFASEGRAVYLVEKDTGFLVGSSTLDPILRLVKEGEDPVRVKATESNDELVQTTASYLDTIGWPERLQVHKGYYIQVRLYNDPGGLSWYIVVVLPASQADDYVQPNSGIEAAIIAMVIFSALFPFAAGIFVVAGRKKVVWRAAQPAFLVLFAIASVAIPIAQLGFLGKNTAETCSSRPWVFNLCFTFMFSILFVKVHRVSLIFNNPSMRKVKMTPIDMLARIFGILILEVIIQACWSLIDANRPMVTTSVGAQGEYVEHTVCSTTTAAFSIISVCFKAILICWGCVLAWKTRNVHGAFAESKALMVTMYNIAFVGIVVLMLYNFLEVNEPTKVLVQVFGVLWVTIVSTVLVYGPRTFQLLTKGDLNMKEIMRQQTMMTQGGTTTVTQSGIDLEKDATIKKLLEEIERMKKEVKALQHKARSMDVEAGMN